MDAYLCGANVHRSESFLGSGSHVEPVTMHNYYLRGFFTEAWLSRWGVRSAAGLLAIMLVLALWPVL
jgi:hypothetical protein